MFFLREINIRFYYYLNICRADVLPKALCHIHKRYFSSAILPFYNILTINRDEFCHLMDEYHYDEVSCEEQRIFFNSLRSKYLSAPWPTEYFDMLMSGERDILRLIICAGTKECFYSLGDSDELVPGLEDITIYVIITARPDMRDAADLFIAATDMAYLRELRRENMVTDLNNFFVYDLRDITAAKRWE
jgi:hypothetical protein